MQAPTTANLKGNVEYEGRIYTPKQFRLEYWCNRGKAIMTVRAFMNGKPLHPPIETER